MSPLYPDLYEFEDFGSLPMDGSEAIGLFMGIYLIFMVLSMAYSVLVYILHSLGTYSIAKRRGIHHAWMSWISPLSIWILGSISDQYQYVAKGRVRNRRKVLIGLYITMIVLAIGIVAGAVAMAIGAESGSFNIETGTGIGLVVGLLAVYLAFFVIAIVMAVFQYIAYYDLFASCNPDNAVAFLVLSIFFTFLLPYFVFASRKKDLGMPPRKPRIPEAPWQPAPPPPVPAWQTQAQQQNTWQPPQPSAWQPPQPSAWQPPQPSAWQAPQPKAWQPPENTWQAPAQPEQPAPAVEVEPEVPEAPKTEE